MQNKILPAKISDVIESRLNTERLYEIRMRSDKAVTVNYGGKFYYLCTEGLTDSRSKAIVTTPQMLNDTVVRASDYSLYVVNRNICDGFITVEGGVRIGITGEYVVENGSIKTVKNFSGLTVRIPHEIIGCADKLLKLLTSGGIKNTMLLSPPACGKTTMLRDLCKSISGISPSYNILLVDERSEIAACKGGVSQLDVGNNVDIVSNCKKSDAIIRGVRSMNPRVVITDELALQEDVDAVYSAVCSGVKVIASAHASDQYDLMNKTFFDRAIKNRLFARYVVLSDKPTVGSVSGVYDENFEQVY